MEYKQICQDVVKKLTAKGADDVVVSGAFDINIFAVFGKRVVATSIKDFEEEKIATTLKNLITFAKNVQPNNEYLGIARGPFTYKKIVDGYDTKIKDMDGVAFVESAVQHAKNKGINRLSGICELKDRGAYIVTSGDVECEDKISAFHFSGRALIDKYATGHVTETSRILKNFKPEIAVDAAGDAA